MPVTKDISVSQPTAWFILQRLRHASKNLFKQEFKGTVEIDEAYLGGSETNRHSLGIKLKGQEEKVIVIGMINCETGMAKAMKVPSSEKEWLLRKINVNVARGSTIVIDTYHVYKDLKKN